MSKNAQRQLTYADYTPNTALYPLTIVLDNVSNPSNVGSIFRLADTLGAEGMVLCDLSPVPPHKLISRAARGADRHVPYTHFAETTAALAHLRTEGYTLVALEITNVSRDLRKVDFTKFGKIALIAGSEEVGIAQPVLDAVDFAVHIPTAGFCLSMNVATSLAVAAYEITKQMAG